MNEIHHTIGLIFFLMPCIIPVVIFLICGLCNYRSKCCCDQRTSHYQRFDTEAGPSTDSSPVIAILLPGKPQESQNSSKQDEDVDEEDVLFSKNDNSCDLITQKAKALEKVLEPHLSLNGQNDAAKF